MSCIWQPMPFGLSCSVVRPVISLLKAGRHDFGLLNLIFRQRVISPKPWRVPESEKNRAEICCGENCVTHQRFSPRSVDVQAVAATAGRMACVIEGRF